MTWSMKCMRIVSAAFFTHAVMLSSSLLGEGLPLGWLWHKAMAVAFFSSASLRIMRTSMAVPVMLRAIYTLLQ